MKYYLDLLETILLWIVFISVANVITKFFFPWEILPASIVLAAFLLRRK